MKCNLEWESDIFIENMWSLCVNKIIYIFENFFIKSSCKNLSIIKISKSYIIVPFGIVELMPFNLDQEIYH